MVISGINKNTIVIDKLEGLMLPCMTKQMFGFDCPGCGLQRAILSLLKGDIIGAWQMYPAIFPLIAFTMILLFRHKLNTVIASKLVPGMAYLTVIFILTNYILKFI